MLAKSTCGCCLLSRAAGTRASAFVAGIREARVRRAHLGRRSSSRVVRACVAHQDGLHRGRMAASLRTGIDGVFVIDAIANCVSFDDLETHLALSRGNHGLIESERIGYLIGKEVLGTVLQRADENG